MFLIVNLVFTTVISTRPSEHLQGDIQIISIGYSLERVEANKMTGKMQSHIYYPGTAVAAYPLFFRSTSRPVLPLFLLFLSDIFIPVSQPPRRFAEHSDEYMRAGISTARYIPRWINLGCVFILDRGHWDFFSCARHA